MGGGGKIALEECKELKGGGFPIKKGRWRKLETCETCSELDHVGERRKLHPVGTKKQNFVFRHTSERKKVGSTRFGPTSSRNRNVHGKWKGRKQVLLNQLCRVK